MKIQFLVAFLSILALSPATSQTISLTVYAPAHVYRVQSYSGGIIRASISWTSDYYSSGTYLTCCLIKGGQYFDSSNCLGLTTRLTTNSLNLVYNVATTDAYFIRIDSSTSTGSQLIKYEITLSSTNPDSSATYIVGYDVSDREKIIRYIDTQISKNSYQKITQTNRTNQVASGSFRTYDAIKFAYDIVFNTIFDSPADMVSTFAQPSN